MAAAEKTDTEGTAGDASDSPSAVRVLVVDNNADHAQVMAEGLSRVGYDCAVATTGPAGARQIELDDFDVVVTDLVMPEIDGLEILARARQMLPDCEVILVSGHANVEKAVEAMQQGAFSVIEKPVKMNRLRAWTEKAAEAVRLKRQNVDLMRRLDEKFGFEGIIYSSSEMEAVVERVRRVAPTDASVLIRGETGTGKELIAKALHQNSPRRKKPFVAINCGAVAEHLVESELFGHIKGAFTDAMTDRVGKFEYANGGTLFLDEVGDMPLPTQIKLLRVLESGEIIPVGENSARKVNVRIISATNRDLEDAIEDGSFRRDLYHRLKVVTVDLPSLAERRDDIVPLVDYFRKQFAKKHNKKVRGISGAVSRRLLAYDWPGNVRQVRNFVESMVVVDIDGILDEDDLPPELADEAPAAGDSAASSGPAAGPVELVGRPLEEIERWAIEQTLKLNGGNREETAKMLGIGSRTLYRKIKEYEL